MTSTPEGRPDYAEINRLETELGMARSSVPHVLLSRDDILKATALPTEEVEVPEWGGMVLVRALSGRERDEFEASMVAQRGEGKNMTLVPDTANVRAKLAAWCITGEDGKPYFTQRDVHALGELSGAALDRVFEVAQRLSGLSEADVEELAGNSPAAQSGASTSA
jgi:hypothetical protein